MEKAGVHSTATQKGSPLQTPHLRPHRQAEKAAGSLPTRSPATTSRVSAQHQVTTASKSVAGRINASGSSHKIPIRIKCISHNPSKASPVSTCQPALSSGSRLLPVECLRKAPSGGVGHLKAGSNGPIGRSAAARATSSSSERPLPSISESAADDKPNVEYFIGIETEFVLSERTRHVQYVNTSDFLRVMAAMFLGWVKM